MSAVVSHQTVRLARGRHRRPEQGVCVMELASMLAGERFSDHPRSVCRVLAELLRACNDRLDEDSRQALYRYAADAVGTAGDADATARRLARLAAAADEHGRLLPRRLRRTPRVPRVLGGFRLERSVAARVRRFPRTPAGDAAMVALVDELLSIGPARDPLVRPSPPAPAPYAPERS